MIRIGVDFGGTKIEAAALADTGEIIARLRTPNPGDYDGALRVLRDLVDAVEAQAGGAVSRIGVGLPGSASPRSGLIRNANSTWLNGRPFLTDLERVLGRAVRAENDANCFALSEAVDGAAAGARVVFGAILGTGCGGGLAIDGRIWPGRNGIAGEWGHTPLPWPSKEEHQAHPCWCGRTDCLETWASGSAFVADYHLETGLTLDGATIAAAAGAGEAAAARVLDRYVSRLGRALAALCNIIDPDVIVLGGGMSNVGALYDRLPAVVAEFLFSDVLETPIHRAAHGDSSGVRGAAWLWPLE